MKYVSIDIETTGLNPKSNQIISFGAIIEDTEKQLPFEEIPKFYAVVLRREIIGSPFAINLNKDLIALMSEYLNLNEDAKKEFQSTSKINFIEPENLSLEFFDFLYENDMVEKENPFSHVRVKNGKSYPVLNSKIKPVTINVAGKNFGTFDKLFLEELENWKRFVRIRQRILDPAILYCDWKKDESLPSLNDCKKRSNISGDVTHNALEDAWDVIKVLRNKY